jgi:hypothetical protein
MQLNLLITVYHFDFGLVMLGNKMRLNITRQIVEESLVCSMSHNREWSTRHIKSTTSIMGVVDSLNQVDHLCPSMFQKKNCNLDSYTIAWL